MAACERKEKPQSLNLKEESGLEPEAKRRRKLWFGVGGVVLVLNNGVRNGKARVWVGWRVGAAKVRGSSEVNVGWVVPSEWYYCRNWTYC